MGSSEDQRLELQNLKLDLRYAWCQHHLERKTDFPVMKMTALEIHSFVASCKYSNWQWIIKDKTQKKP